MRALRLAAKATLVAVLCVAPAVARADEYPWVRFGEPARTLCATGPAAAPGPGAGWTDPLFEDDTWNGLPTAATPATSAVPDGGAPRCETVRLRRRFDVGPELSRLATLTLKVRYKDGFVAWLNGVEIARRRYLDGAPLATELHGGAPERLFLPIQPGLLRPTGNVLAIEVHAGKPGRAAFVEVALGGADALRLVRGPHLLRTFGGEAVVSVESDLPSRAEVRFGELGADRARDRTATDGQLATRHNLTLRGLAPGRSYHYRVTLREPVSGDPVSVEAAFHTPPASRDKPLRFVVTGDVRSGHDVHEKLVRAIVAEDPDLVLMTGDLVEIGSDEAEWQRFFDIEAPLLRQVPVYSALGNHDHWRSENGFARFQSLFGRERQRGWWSFDVAGVHFVLLDSEAYRDPEQLAWLRADLDAARKAKARAIFACVHHGPYSSALHGDNQTAIRDYVPVLEAAGVTLLFAGHDHNYERGRVGRLDYVVSGGGGAELRPARCGVPGRRACPPHIRAFANEHHYIVVEVRRDLVRLCPRRPDGTPIESCPTIPLPRSNERAVRRN